MPPPHPGARPLCAATEGGVRREDDAVLAPVRLTWLAHLRAPLQRWVRPLWPAAAALLTAAAALAAPRTQGLPPFVTAPARRHG